MLKYDQQLSMLIPGKLYKTIKHGKVVWDSRDFNSTDNRTLNIKEIFMLIDVCPTGAPGPAEFECGVLLNNNKVGVVYLKENKINSEIKLAE